MTINYRKALWSAEIVMMTAAAGVALYTYGTLNLGLGQAVEEDPENPCGYLKKARDQ